MEQSFLWIWTFELGECMTRERLAKELEKTRERIAELQEKERQLAEAKEKADMEASKAIVEKKKIDPEVLQALCAMKEHEIKEILERRKKQDEESKKNII